MEEARGENAPGSECRGRNQLQFQPLILTLKTIRRRVPRRRQPAPLHSKGDRHSVRSRLRYKPVKKIVYCTAALSKAKARSQSFGCHAKGGNVTTVLLESISGIRTGPAMQLCKAQMSPAPWNGLAQHKARAGKPSGASLSGNLDPRDGKEGGRAARKARRAHTTLLTGKASPPRRDARKDSRRGALAGPQRHRRRPRSLHRPRQTNARDASLSAAGALSKGGRVRP